MVIVCRSPAPRLYTHLESRQLSICINERLILKSSARNASNSIIVRVSGCNIHVGRVDSYNATLQPDNLTLVAQPSTFFTG
jgi:hypothetical protein